MLQTDTSAIEIGAVLEQGGQVVAYSSHVLTPPEKSYSVIQQEWLVIVYALKQFRHYLLGCHFTPQADHALLQWVTSQKMEGLLCRWSLSLQVFDFNIDYHKGISNTNADTWSCCHEEGTRQHNVAATLINSEETDLQKDQQ